MPRFAYPDLLKEMIDKRFVNVQKHPRLPLWLYNYSKRAQHKDVWNEVTVACRGLIMDKEMNIVSRPFKKIFNYWDFDTVNFSREKFTVTEKIDGSLGISYYYKGIWRIATRGSFDGKQANHANKILRKKYAKSIKKMHPELTYLFEIIYPENRIVVDYGDREELILLAVIDTETGTELTDVENIGFSVPKTYDEINSFEKIVKFKENGENNAEGVVVRFESGLRLKVKFEKYMYLHTIMLGLTGIKVWNYLSKNNDLEKLYSLAATGEQLLWLKKTAEIIFAEYENFKREIMTAYHALPYFRNIEEAVKYISGKENEAIFLNLLNKKSIEKMLWQKVKPAESNSWFAERG